MSGRTAVTRLIGFAATLALAMPSVASAATETFLFTQAEQTFVVPADVHSIQVDASGADGFAAEVGAAPAVTVPASQERSR